MPLETEERHMTEYVNQNCHVHGFITPHKILKVYDTKLVQGYTTYRTYENILTNEYIYLRDGVELSTMTNHPEKKHDVMIDMKTNQ